MDSRPSIVLAGALAFLASACIEPVKVEIVTPVVAVTITPTAVNLTLDQSMSSSQALTATVHDANGHVLVGRTVVWGSSAPSAATVSPVGLVTAVRAGASTVTATCEGKAATATVTVALNSIPFATFAPVLAVNLAASTLTTTGLYWRDLSTGAGSVAVSGNRLTVAFTGYLSNGAVFQTVPSFGFLLGAGQVIAGWDQGIVGMRIGGRRQLVIPPSLGWGANVSGSVPANSILVFNVELVSIP